GHRLLRAVRDAIDVPQPTPGTMRELIDQARRYAAHIEIRDAGDVLAELARLHPVEMLLGLEHAVARWVAAVDVPADLLPLLPELRAHCAPRFDRAPADLSRLALGPGPGKQAPLYDELVAAIDGMLRASTGR
ncbi:MAG: hypothetical protein KIT31_27530, partial [Deltaproteobacteria bacterium]|nr:hypothetical protein [Deltaproteobacteria bacterium]